MKFLTLFSIIAALFTTLSATAGELALKGYSPVSYFTEEKAEKGSEEFTSEYEGKTYQFTSAEQKKQFDGKPSKFLPQYDGFCAYGVSVAGAKFEIDPTVFKVVRGKLYLNKDNGIGAKFQEDYRNHIRQADKKWRKLK